MKLQLKEALQNALVTAYHYTHRSSQMDKELDILGYSEDIPIEEIVQELSTKELENLFIKTFN